MQKMNSSKKAGKGGRAAPISSFTVVSEIDLGTPAGSGLNMNKDGNSVENSYTAQGPSQQSYLNIPNQQQVKSELSNYALAKSPAELKYEAYQKLMTERLQTTEECRQIAGNLERMNSKSIEKVHKIMSEMGQYPVSTARKNENVQSSMYGLNQLNLHKRMSAVSPE